MSFLQLKYNEWFVCMQKLSLFLSTEINLDKGKYK